MTADPRKRWAILGTLLLATLAAVLFVDDENAGTDTPPARERRVASATAPARADTAIPATRETPLALPDLSPPAQSAEKTDNAEPERHDPFRVTSWVITPPPPPPTEPTAPPLPFKYLGKLIDDGRHIVFLSEQNTYLIAREGDRIGTYRVEEITPKKMTFLYEPLKKRQELAIGEN